MVHNLLNMGIARQQRNVFYFCNGMLELPPAHVCRDTWIYLNGRLLACRAPWSKMSAAAKPLKSSGSSALESHPFPAWLSDLAGRQVLAINREGRRLCGVRNDETGPFLVGDLLLPEQLGSDLRTRNEGLWAEDPPLRRHQLRRRDAATVLVCVRKTASSGVPALHWDVLFEDSQAGSATASARSPGNAAAPDDSIGFGREMQGLLTFMAQVPCAMAICTFDEGRWVQCTAAMRNLLGIQEDEWRGKSSVEMNLWHDPMERSRMMRLLVDNGSFSGLPVKLRHKDGHLVDAVVSCHTFSDHGNKYTVAHYHDASDVMARLRASEANEALLSRALQGAASAVWEWDLRTDTYQYVERWEKLLGYDPGELPHNSSSLQYLLHPDDAAFVASQLEAHFTNFNPFTIEARLRTKAGPYRWFFVRGQAEKDENGRAVRMSGTIDDSTEKRLLDAERLRVNERLALATNAVGLGTWEVFTDGSALWDAQTYRLYGRDPATAVLPETICREATGTAQYRKLTAWLGETMRQESFGSIEFSVMWPDGQTRWIAAKGRAIKDSGGRPVSLIGVNWDITEQRRAAAVQQAHQAELSSLNHRLMDQEKRISTSLAYSLHDQVGQTLAALRLGIDTLKLRSLSDPQLATQCDTLEALVGKAVQDVRDTLHHLRPPMLDELGLGRALESEMLGMPFLTGSTELTLVADERVLNLRWPPDVEYAAFMIAREAVTNALKHARCSQVIVELCSEAGRMGLSISDDGTGIAAPIFQLRPGHLGLLSIRERAQAISASLHIDSSPSVGTRISLTWPSTP